MRLLSGRPGPAVPEITLHLTSAEASELRDALDDMLQQDPPDLAWHAHVASVDHSNEIAVAWDVPPD